MDRLIALQRTIAAQADPDRDPSFIDRLCVTQVQDHVLLEFFGDPFGQPFADVLEVLADQAVANSIIALSLRGPDEGCNGTRNWDLSPIAESDLVFSNLRHLSIEQTKPADHNRSIVASSYEEEGILARILAKSPCIESLVTPSAPNADFFQVGQRPIRFLSVDSGYDHQGFIRNLARSSCFPDLQSFEFGEYNETYIEDFPSHVTAFADYRELFSSPAFETVNVFRWRNPVCSPAEMAEVKALMQTRQFMVVRWSAEWIR